MMRQLSGRRIRNTEMTTFGKEKTELIGKSSDGKLVVIVCHICLEGRISSQNISKDSKNIEWSIFE